MYCSHSDTSCMLCRFSATDPRCGMELDEIDPAVWELLETATDEYIEQQDSRLDAAASALIEDITVSRPYSITRQRLGKSFCPAVELFYLLCMQHVQPLPGWQTREQVNFLLVSI